MSEEDLEEAAAIDAAEEPEAPKGTPQLPGRRSVIVTLKADEAAAYHNFQLAATTLMEIERTYRAAQQTYAEAVKVMSNTAVQSK